MIAFEIVETLHNILRAKMKYEIEYINCTFDALTI